MQLAAHLAELVRHSNISGHEAALARYLEAAWAPLVDEFRLDRLGNAIGLKRGRGGPRLLAAAHLDSIGMMVTRVEAGGFLRVASVGGVDRRTLLGLEVVVGGRRPVPGVFGARPPHLTAPDERTRLPALDDLFIDTGLPEATVRELAAPGDPVTFRQEPVLLQGGRMASRYLDNRASVAALGLALHELRGVAHAADFYAVGTVGEEFGGIPGAVTAGYGVAPDVAIAVDVTFGQHPGATDDAFALDGGPTVMVGPNVHAGLAKWMRQVAQAAGIPHVVEVAPESSGTDAWAMQTARAGALTGVISIPIRYMHTPVETVSLSDIEHAGRLLARLIAALDEGMVARWISSC